MTTRDLIRILRRIDPHGDATVRMSDDCPLTAVEKRDDRPSTVYLSDAEHGPNCDCMACIDNAIDSFA